MSTDDPTPESAMQRFEDLATRLFSITPEDTDKVEEVAEEAADEIIESPEEPTADE